MSDLVERLRSEVTVSSGTVTPLRLEAADRIEELEAAIDAREIEARYSDKGNLWRFWSDKAQKYVAENARMRKTVKLIAQRAQTATADDAEDALTWIYHAARQPGS